jgi:hypothetical protein
MNSVKLNQEQKDRLHDMLASNNPEDTIVAYSTMERLDITENIAHILCILKDAGQTNFNHSLFNEHFPSILKLFKIEENNAHKFNQYIRETDFTYKLMLDKVKTVNPSELETVTKYIQDVLLNHFETLSLDFIKDINITLSDEYTNYK